MYTTRTYITTEVSVRIWDHV